MRERKRENERHREREIDRMSERESKKISLHAFTEQLNARILKYRRVFNIDLCITF